MKISIIVPVYNIENYIAECLDSILSQDFSDFEILCVDDGSKDNSFNVIKQYQLNYPEIVKVFKKENGGLSDARNFGLNHAIGDYLLFIDGDDWLLPNMLKEMYQKAMTHQAKIVVCDFEFVYPTRVEYVSGGDFDCTSLKEQPELLAINNSACNKLYHKSLFEMKRFPKGLWYEDLATIPALYFDAVQIAKVSKPFYQYRQREGSIMHSVDERVFDIYTALNEVKSRISTVDDVIYKEKLQEQLDKLYVMHCVDMTSLRCLNSKDPVAFLTRHVALLDKESRAWLKNAYKLKYGMKKNIFFTLLKFKMFKLIIKLMS